MSKEVQDIFQAKAGALSETNQEILNDYIVAWIAHSKATQSKDEWKALWERSKSEECLLQPPDEVFEEAELDSYEVYTTADFQDDVTLCDTLRCHKAMLRSLGARGRQPRKIPTACPSRPTPVVWIKDLSVARLQGFESGFGRHAEIS